MTEQPTPEELARELKAIECDLRTSKEHLGRITAAARHLAEAIKVIAKPSQTPET